tara:strand:+ start:73 stop:399 length:327 start_codon:yes stop_codon:yes gene_type:complete
MISNMEAFAIKPVIFTKASTSINGVRSEYLVESTKVKFHFWPEPEFPSHFETSVKSALRNFKSESYEVEYVPEVDSWYLCISNLPFKLTPVFVEGILKKIASAVCINE